MRGADHDHLHPALAVDEQPHLAARRSAEHGQLAGLLGREATLGRIAALVEPRQPLALAGLEPVDIALDLGYGTSPASARYEAIMAS